MAFLNQPLRSFNFLKPILNLMSPSLIGAVWMFGGNFAPYGFAFCDGSLQSIAENETLYSLLGTTYGGDGVSTFALPDLRGRSVIGQGTGPGLPSYVEGQISGNESISITTANMAAHTHLLNASATATSQTPSSNLYVAAGMAGTNAVDFYSNATPGATLVGNTVGVSGNSIPVGIIQPYLAVSYVIALYGVYPTQN